MSEKNSTPILSMAALAWGFYPKLVFSAALCGLISGLIGIMLVDTINTAIYTKITNQAIVLQFCILVVLQVIFTSFSAIIPIHMGNRIDITLRLALYQNIVTSPLNELERRGLSNLLTLLNLDVPSITRTIIVMPFMASHVSALVFGLLYLAHQSFWLFAFISFSIFLGCVIYFLFYSKGIAIARQASDEYSILNEHVRGLIYGIKELKLSQQRRKWFRKVFNLSIKKAATFQFREHLTFSLGEVSSQFLYFLILGCILFGLPLISVTDSAVITSCILCIMFMMGPLGQLVNIIPEIGKGTVGLERLAANGFPVTKIGMQIKSNNICNDGSQTIWREIKMVNIEMPYSPQDEGREFKLGPINLSIHPGDLIYIVGGNGSGKSTLAKVLTGLYNPTVGHIYIDDEILGKQNIERYRNLFSSIFSDFYLFQRISPGGIQPIDWDRAHQCLDELGLTGLVSLKGYNISTTTLLSTGQRRRLALLCAFIEDRPIYIFDEWAADQDPIFKKFFYEKLLPKLKLDGKCALVITHDDQYFQHANRIIKMRDGSIFSDVTIGQ